jgi:hypothetical protein
MTTLVHDDHNLHGLVRAATRALSHASISVPASKKDRDAAMVDYRRVRGLDLSDADRADRIRRAVS